MAARGLTDIRIRPKALNIYALYTPNALNIYALYTPKDSQRHPRESTDISVKHRARPCYNIYVTLSIVVYSAAHNYPGITTLQVRYYTVRGYHIGLAFQKLRKRRDG